MTRSVIGAIAAFALGCGGSFGDPQGEADAQPRSADAGPSPDAAVDAAPQIVPAMCDDGDARVSDALSGNCYLRFDTAVTWTVASARCQMIGAHLASITSAAENDVVATIAPQNQVNPADFDVWLGGNDIGAEGTWAWEVTAEPFAFMNFRAGEPNNNDPDDPAGEDCLVFEGDTLEWDDRSCQMASQKYFCEREATLE